MDSDDDSDLNSLASASSGVDSSLFTPFTPLLTLRDSKSQTTLSLLSSILSTVTSLGLPNQDVDDDTSTKIGEGATYCVEKGYMICGKGSGLVAIKRTKFTVPKVVTKAYTEDPSLRRRIRSVLLEIQVLAHPSLRNHPNFVHLLGYSWEETATGYSPAILVDLAEFGSLDEFATSDLSWRDKRILCDDIAIGLGALHSCGIAHGDMKPDNVLVSKHPERRFIAKISDFEHALLGTDVVKYGGTPIYNAPEVHLQEHPSKKLTIPIRDFPFCDVFSFGLSVFEVFCDGKRYYQNEDTRSFRDLLTSFDYAKDELLDLALDFLKVQEFPPDMLRVCWDVFQQTLCFRPRDRLRGGWGHIRELIRAETFASSQISVGSVEVLPTPPMKALETDYSILSLYRSIKFDSDTVRLEIATELRYHSGQSILPSEERAKAAFQLSICNAIGFGQLVNAQESANWLLQAALHGHEPSLIIGARIMDANELPIPDVLLYSPLSQEIRDLMSLLDDLAPEDYYSNAVRILWGGELRKLALKPVDVEGDIVYFTQRQEFLKWFNSQHISRNSPAINEFIDRNFLLHHAVAIGDIEISRVLIQNGGTINLVNFRGQTPLYLGCRGGHADVVKMLLSEGADSSLCDTNGITPLHWLVLFPMAEIKGIARLLVLQGANPDFMMRKLDFGVYFDQLGLDLYGSPLHWACLCRNQFALETLLSLRSDPDTSILRSLVSVSLRVLCADIVEILISTGSILATFSEEDRKLLYSAIGEELIKNFQRWIIHGKGYRQAYISCVSLLQKNGVPVGDSLLVAAKGLSLNLAEALIAQGANPSEREPKTGRTPLHLVLIFCIDRFRLPALLEMVELLLKNGATMEEDLGTSYRMPALNLLEVACAYEAPAEVVRLLLTYGVHNMVDFHTHATKSLYQCIGSHLTELLLEFGADPNFERLDHESSFRAPREDYMEPRYCCLTTAGEAVLNGEWEILKVLLDSGTTLMVGLTGGHQQTLLHLAVLRYYLRINQYTYNPKVLGGANEILEMLLDHPVIREAKIINVPDWRGFTPLKYAIWFAIPSCTEILLSRGAQIDDTSSGITSRMVVDEFYRNTPYFVRDEGVDELNHNRNHRQIPRQLRLGYHTELEKIVSILEADSNKVLRPTSDLTISD